MVSTSRVEPGITTQSKQASAGQGDGGEAQEEAMTCPREREQRALQR